MDYNSNDFCNNSSDKSDYQRPTSPDERESVSLPPLNAMAFTIPLDEPKVKWKGKNFSIKDAIRKFAPPKPDTIEKQRPIKSRSSDTEKNTSKSKDKLIKDDKGKIPKEPEGHVSDSASYLIQRMLNDESQQLQCDNMDDRDTERSNLKRSDSKRKVRDSVNSAKRSSSVNGCIGEKDSGVCDDKSESGTYTLDKNDPVVEEARRRIDQVFGVPSESNQLFPSSSSLDRMTSSLASISALKSLLSSPSKAEVNLYSSSATINRSSNDQRRQSDTKPPLVNSTFLNSRVNVSCPSSNPGSDSESNSYPIVKPQRKHNYKSEDADASKDQSSMWSRKNSMDRSSIRNRTHSFTKKSSQSPSSSPTPSSILRASGVPSGSTKAYTSGSAINLTNQGCDKLKRVNSNQRNGSDIDLGDDDTNSLKSDASNASTEPSSGSGQCKSLDNSNKTSMRFNRAFALRRAKLGMDTLGVPLNLTAERQAHHNSILESRSNPRSTPSPTFNRSDGGRFSLRVMNNNQNSNRKPPAGNPNHWSRQSTSGSGNNNARQPIVNKLRTMSTSSDTENRCSSPGQSPCRSMKSFPIQKSSSFHNPKESSTLSSVRQQVSNLRGMSPFSVSKRFFSTKPHQQHQMGYNSDNTGLGNNHNSTGMQHNLSASRKTNQNYEDRRNNMSESLNDSKLSRLTGSHRNPAQSSIPSSTPLNKGVHANSPSSPLSPSTPNRAIYNGNNGEGKGKELSALDKLVISAIFQLSHKLRYNLRVILDNERIKYPKGNETRLMIEELLPQVSVQEKRMLDNGDLSRDLSHILKNLKKVEQSFDVVTLLLANGNANSFSGSSSPGGDNDFYGDVNVSCSDFQDEY